MTVPTHRSIQSGSTDSGTSFAINKPAGLAAGDIMILQIYYESNSAITVTPPSGFAIIDGCTVDNTGPNPDIHGRAYWKRADATDVAASSFTISFSGTVAAVGNLSATSGAVASGTPVEDSDKASANSATCDLPALDTLTNDTLVVGMVSSFEWTNTWTSATTSFENERVDANGSAYYTVPQATAGSTGAKKATQNAGAQMFGMILNIASIAGSSPVTVAIKTATLTATPIPSDAIPGAVAKIIKTATLTATGINATINAPIPGRSVTVKTATITSAGIAVDVVPGAVAKTLGTATLTATGIILDVVPGAMSVVLDAASLTATGIAADVLPGTVTIALDTAPITITGIPLDIVPGNIIKPLNVATLTITGIPLSISAVAPGQTVSLDTAGITATGIAADINAPIAISLDTAIITGAGINITISAPISGLNILLDTATITATGITLDVVPGAVTLGLNTATLMAIGVSASPKLPSIEIPTVATPMFAPGYWQWLSGQREKIEKELEDELVIIMASAMAIHERRN